MGEILTASAELTAPNCLVITKINLNFCSAVVLEESSCPRGTIYKSLSLSLDHEVIEKLTMTSHSANKVHKFGYRQRA